jgi:hypothetical protein
MANPLMLVWKLGTDGPYTLLLDPAAARRAYGQLPVDPAEQATHVPMNDVDAPIWYVPSGEVNLRHPVAGRCDA